MIVHYDLFAGIGGFSLALERVFDDTIEHVFCEWDEFCTAVLKKHWPDETYYGDIADLVAETASKGLEGGAGSELQGRNKRSAGNITILTGGFPCQPFSAAGRRKGTNDDRYKWPEMFDVIRNVKPDWIIAENVRGLVTWNEGMVLETVCTDLEREGYEVQPLIIPAVAKDAPHRRDRVWIVANPRPQRRSERGDENIRPKKLQSERPNYKYPDWQRNWQEVAFATCYDGMDARLSSWLDFITEIEGEKIDANDTTRITRQNMLEVWRAIQSDTVWQSFRRCFEVQESEILFETLRQFSREPKVLEQRNQGEGESFEKEIVRRMWEQEQATRPSRKREFIRQHTREHQDALRNLPQEASLATLEAWHILQLIRQALIPQEATVDGTTISAARHRKERLKAMGNAIVPQVAMEIFTAIKAEMVGYGHHPRTSA